MQKRAKDAKELTYNTEYDPYEDFLQKTPSKLRIGYHDPDFALISGLHYHDVVEVGLCLEGNGIFIVDGQMIPFVAPCVNVIYPGQLHKGRSTGEKASHWAFINFRAESVFPREFPLYDRLPWDNASAVYALSDDSRLVSLVREIVEEWEQNPQGWEDAARGLLATVLIRHARLPHQATDSKQRRREKRDELKRLHPILQYIDTHFNEPLNVAELAARFHMHPATLRKRFNLAVGISPLRYIHRIRLSTACSFLRGTDATVAEIASDVGYQSISSFNRHFQEEYGVSPTAYRNGEQ